MKLIIQIPCLDEADSLPATIADLPREVAGVDTIEWMVIDDGSTDDTFEVARSLGVDHVVRLNGHRGLAQAFAVGLITAVEHGADIIVNTDADNQYDASDISKLVMPIVEGRADIVVGARPIRTIRHFSRVKRCLQYLGSCLVRSLSGTEVRDATSGFRALSREAALRLHVFGGFTYTIETIIQAGMSNLRVLSVPIAVNGPTRPSRLFKSNLAYVCRSVLTMLSAYVIYQPTRIFGAMSAASLALGVAFGARYMVLMMMGQGTGHVQSVIACAIFILSGVFLGAIGMIAHLQSINRKLLEEIRYLGLSVLSKPGRHGSRGAAQCDGPHPRDVVIEPHPRLEESVT
jgi:glycosyltransferase involved in cell wall biosynthesis